ncbi:MAG: N-acetylmuramoyl-L-alanine amidase [Chloroflexi bacterium]|nr:N-acetylmuramoyl-L-alanine amidase [Chloroflexota bacterium]
MAIQPARSLTASRLLVALVLVALALLAACSSDEESGAPESTGAGSTVVESTGAGSTEAESTEAGSTRAESTRAGPNLPGAAIAVGAESVGPARLPGQGPRSDGEPFDESSDDPSDDTGGGSSVDVVPARVDPSAPVTVVLDPGHGGDDAGAIAAGIVERESNLGIALRVEEILIARGYRVVLTRRDSGYSSLYPDDAEIPELAVERTDLQARVDLANLEGAAVFVSIHSNLSPSRAERGLEIWYDADRPFSLANFRLAVGTFQEVAAELITFGYPLKPRGLLNDRCHSFDADLGRCLPLFVLGPASTLTRWQVLGAGISPDRFAFGEADILTTRATQMPAMLVELLFLSNSADAAMLRSNSARQAMARGVARGIVRFLEGDDQVRPASPEELLALGR